MTPLHTAALFGNVSMARVLLESAKADVNARRNDGRTPLDMLGFRIDGTMSAREEFQLVDDLEKRTWYRKTRQMKQLLESYGAITDLLSSEDQV